MLVSDSSDVAFSMVYPFAPADLSLMYKNKLVRCAHFISRETSRVSPMANIRAGVSRKCRIAFLVTGLSFMLRAI